MLPLQILNVIVIIVMLYFVIDLFAADQDDSSRSSAKGMAAVRGAASLAGSPASVQNPPTMHGAPRPAFSRIEGDTLLMMREKKTLVRNYFREMHARWHADIFRQLQDGEERHLARLTSMLPPGVIANATNEHRPHKKDLSEMANLYPVLLERGSKSLDDALVAGAMVQMCAMSDAIDLEEGCRNAEIQKLLLLCRKHCCAQMKLMKAQLLRAA